jgi:hypothetical protein
LLREVESCPSAGFELLLASRTAQLRYSWRKPAAAPIVFHSRPPVVAFTRPDDLFCQVQLLELPAGEAQTDLLPKVTTILETLALLWRTTGEIQPPAELGIEVHYMAVEFARRAA